LGTAVELRDAFIPSHPTPTLLFSHLACESKASVLTTRTRSLFVFAITTALFLIAHCSSCTGAGEYCSRQTIPE
jgi:hypothetical protein